MIGQPQEFKLTVNLRSPRRIVPSRCLCICRFAALSGRLLCEDALAPQFFCEHTTHCIIAATEMCEGLTSTVVGPRRCGIEGLFPYGQTIQTC